MRSPVVPEAEMRSRPTHHSTAPLVPSGRRARLWRGIGLPAVMVILALLLSASPGRAGVPTEITVHVLAHDAKLIGDVAGGARVVIREEATGRILAEGIQRGGTGDTDLIVREPRVRGEDRLTTEGAARFAATLDLDHPTWIVVEAEGPLGFPSATTRASRRLLAVPGRHLDGDGVVLTLQGLIVSLLAPTPEDALQAGGTLAIEAGVKLLCTCPIEDGGLWDATDYEVVAELWRGDALVASAPLGFSGRTNVFAGSLGIPVPEEEDDGVHLLRIVAGHPGTGNWGHDQAVYRIRN